MDLVVRVSDVGESGVGCSELQGVLHLRVGERGERGRCEGGREGALCLLGMSTECRV